MKKTDTTQKEENSLKWYKTNKRDKGIGIVNVRNMTDLEKTAKTRIKCMSTERADQYTRDAESIWKRGPEDTTNKGERAMKREKKKEVYEPLRFDVEKLKLRNSKLAFEVFRLSVDKTLGALLSMEGEPLTEC